LTSKGERAKLLNSRRIVLIVGVSDHLKFDGYVLGNR